MQRLRTGQRKDGRRGRGERRRLRTAVVDRHWISIDQWPDQLDGEFKKSLRAVLFLGAGRGTTVEDSHSPSAATRKPGAWPDEMKRPAANEGARRRPAPDAIRRVRYGVQGPPIAGSAGSQERGASRCKGALPPAQRRRGWPRQNEPHGSWLGSRVHRRARTGRTFRSCFNNVERIAIGSRRIGKCLGRNWCCSQRRSQRLALADGGGPPQAARWSALAHFPCSFGFLAVGQCRSVPAVINWMDAGGPFCAGEVESAAVVEGPEREIARIRWRCGAVACIASRF
jgi:hypothetical protein